MSPSGQLRDMSGVERLRSISRGRSPRLAMSPINLSQSGIRMSSPSALMRPLVPGVDDQPIVVAAKLEENLARESCVLRADNADIRSSVSDFSRVLLEERKERQGDLAELNRRFKDHLFKAEEKYEYFEGLLRARNLQANELRTTVQEVEKLREITEIQALQAVNDEGRLRENADSWERSDRQRSIEEQDQRFRALMRDERDLREREMGEVALRIARIDDAVRTNSEAINARILELGCTCDELKAQTNSLERQAFNEVQQVLRQGEELRKELGSEIRERGREVEATLAQLENLEAACTAAANRAEREVAQVKRALLDVQEANHVEIAKIETVLPAIQTSVLEERRLREEATGDLNRKTEGQEDRMEQRWWSRFREERALREEVEGELGQRMQSLAAEQGESRARAMAACQELAQEVRGAQENVRVERDMRRREFQQLANILPDGSALIARLRTQ